MHSKRYVRALLHFYRQKSTSQEHPPSKTFEVFLLSIIHAFKIVFQYSPRYIHTFLLLSVFFFRILYLLLHENMHFQIMQLINAILIILLPSNPNILYLYFQPISHLLLK